MGAGCRLAALFAGAVIGICSAQSRVPVLVELFTSEGCSSCPPADHVLQQLDSHAIVLSEHVDYWDHQGWKDRFSSPSFTMRQQAYARIFAIDGPYTPEMVVDGAKEFNGSDAKQAGEAITAAARRKKAEVRLARTDAGLQVEVDPVPASADVFLALADESATTDVGAGENSGKRLRHVAIVRSLRKIGSVKRGAAFSKLIELPRETAGQRAVVFVQESGPGRVSGAAVSVPASYSPAP